MKSTLQERQQNEKHGEHLYNNANPYKKKISPTNTNTPSLLEHIDNISTVSEEILHISQKNLQFAAKLLIFK